MTKPKISIVAYDASFRERWFQIDSLVNQTLDNDLFEFIFVENFDTVNLNLKDKLQDTSLTYKFITLNRDKSYHLGKCANEGVKQSESDLITILDADTYLQPNVLEETLNHHNNNPDLVFYVRRYDEPQPPILRTHDNITLNKLKSACELINPSNYGGFMSISKENYIKSGGYSEHPVFSGYDSAGALDLKTRYDNMGLDCRWSNDLKIYHICHENAFDSNRWNGFKVESQWKIIDMRRENGAVKPFIGIDGRYREPDEWWEEWLGKFDDESVGYELNKWKR